MMYSKVIGTGSYLPEKILTNQDLERMVDTSDEWIRTRTGIAQRHIAADNEMASDLALNASRQAMAAAGVKAARYRSDHCRHYYTRRDFSQHCLYFAG